MTSTAPVVTTTESMERIRTLDGLRAIAAGMVFLHHLGFNTGRTFDWWWGGVLNHLDVGVPVFFAISGFLLYHPHVTGALDDRASPDLVRYYQRRAVRIYAPWWLAFFGTAIFFGVAASVRQWPLHLSLTHIYSGETFFTAVTQSWTLAVEVVFYLLLPFYAAGMKRLVQGRPVDHRALILLLGPIALYGLSLVYRMVVFATDFSSQPVVLPGSGDRVPISGEIAIFWLPGMIDYFAIGMAAAILLAWSERRDTAKPLVEALGSRPWLWWAGAAAAIVFTSNQLRLPRGLERAVWTSEVYEQFLYGVVAICLLVPAVFGRHRRIVRPLAGRILTWLGAISYGFYLWHVQIIEQVLEWTDTPKFSGEFVRTGALAMAITIAVAAAAYYAVEEPTMRWVRRRQNR